VDKNVLIVRTAKGDVRVMLESKTQIILPEHAGRASDLKPGLRVVVDVPEGSKIKVAHSVEIGTAGE
jgi:hypothetical protein